MTTTQPTSLSNITNFITITLDSTNYLVWKNQVEDILLTCDLYGYVDGTISHPKIQADDSTPSKPSTEYQTWQKQDRFVKCCLSALSLSIAPLSLGCRTARDLWETLEQHFLQQIVSQRSLLRKKLHTLRKGNLSVSDYLTTISTTSQELAAIGDKIPDNDLLLFALNGLPPDYAPFITAIENSQPRPSFREFRARLLNHDQRRNSATLRHSSCR